MKLKYLTTLVLFLMGYWEVVTQGQVMNATISCTSCTTYIVTIGNSSAGTTVTCPIGTVCGVSNTTTNACAATNPCDGIVCDRYAVFPSAASCRQYHICRYVRGYAAFVVSTYTCPGISLFDMNSNKCTVRSSALCYDATEAG